MLLSLTSIRIESVNNNMADEDDMEEDGYDGLSDVDEDSDEDFDFVVPVDEEQLGGRVQTYTNNMQRKITR